MLTKMVEYCCRNISFLRWGGMAMKRNSKNFNFAQKTLMLMLMMVFSIFCGLTLNEVAAKAMDVSQEVEVYYQNNDQYEWAKKKVVGITLPNSMGASFGAVVEGNELPYETNIDLAKAEYEKGEGNPLAITDAAGGKKVAFFEVDAEGEYTIIILDAVNEEDYIWMVVNVTNIDTTAPELDNAGELSSVQYKDFVVELSNESPLKEVFIDGELVYTFNAEEQAKRNITLKITRDRLVSLNCGKFIELKVTDVAGNEGTWKIEVDVKAPTVKAGIKMGDKENYLYQYDGKFNFSVIDDHEVDLSSSYVDVFYVPVEDINDDVKVTAALRLLKESTAKYRLRLNQLQFDNNVYSVSLTKNNFYRFELKLVDAYMNNIITSVDYKEDAGHSTLTKDNVFYHKTIELGTYAPSVTVMSADSATISK